MYHDIQVETLPSSQPLLQSLRDGTVSALDPDYGTLNGIQFPIFRYVDEFFVDHGYWAIDSSFNWISIQLDDKQKPKLSIAIGSFLSSTERKYTEPIAKAFYSSYERSYATVQQVDLGNANVLEKLDHLHIYTASAYSVSVRTVEEDRKTVLLESCLYESNEPEYKYDPSNDGFNLLPVEEKRVSAQSAIYISDDLWFYAAPYSCSLQGESEDVTSYISTYSGCSFDGIIEKLTEFTSTPYAYSLQGESEEWFVLSPTYGEDNLQPKIISYTKPDNAFAVNVNADTFIDMPEVSFSFLSVEDSYKYVDDVDVHSLYKGVDGVISHEYSLSPMAFYINPSDAKVVEAVFANSVNIDGSGEKYAEYTDDERSIKIASSGFSFNMIDSENGFSFSEKSGIYFSNTNRAVAYIESVNKYYESVSRNTSVGTESAVWIDIVSRAVVRAVIRFFGNSVGAFLLDGIQVEGYDDFENIRWQVIKHLGVNNWNWAVEWPQIPKNQNEVVTKIIDRYVDSVFDPSKFSETIKDDKGRVTKITFFNDEQWEWPRYSVDFTYADDVTLDLATSHAEHYHISGIITHVIDETYGEDIHGDIISISQQVTTLAIPPISTPYTGTDYPGTGDNILQNGQCRIWMNTNDSPTTVWMVTKNQDGEYGVVQSSQVTNVTPSTGGALLVEAT